MAPEQGKTQTSQPPDDRAGLKQRGVSSEVASGALEGYDSLDAAYRAAGRYSARQAGNNRGIFDRRVGAFLARRGFESSIVRQTLDRLREELGVGDVGPSDG